jgi:acyl-CoA synthetase (AMP-forming)/AMP-acid ligase II
VARGTRVEIVNPETCRQCRAQEIGEVWIASDSVAAGYWNKPEDTKELLQATLADTGEKPFLRTGDLGYLEKGELFITGRLKDLIIIRGRNIYPQDVESKVESLGTWMHGNSCAAFAFDLNGQEHLGLVIEGDRHMVQAALDDSGQIEDWICKINAAVARAFDVQIFAVAILKPGTFPRTSSGKVQRRACREGLTARTLDTVYEWRALEAVKVR